MIPFIRKYCVQWHRLCYITIGILLYSIIKQNKNHLPKYFFYCFIINSPKIIIPIIKLKIELYS